MDFFQYNNPIRFHQKLLVVLWGHVCRQILKLEAFTPEVKNDFRFKCQLMLVQGTMCRTNTRASNGRRCRNLLTGAGW